MCTALRGGKLELTPVKGCIPKRSAQSTAGEVKGIFPAEKSWLIDYRVPVRRRTELLSALRRP